MLIRTAITATVLASGLGLAGWARAAEAELPPPPRAGGFERVDQNQDGVLQREEFEKARGRHDGQRRHERGVRGERGPRGGDGPRGVFRDDGSLERRIDDAIDRAMKRAEGNPEELRRALHDELSQVVRKGRGRQGPLEAPLTAPDAERIDRRRGAPPGERGRGFGERGDRPGPRDERGFRGDRRGGRPGGREGGGILRRNPDERAKRIMERFDGNDDGVLTEDELNSERAKRLMRADANGDDRVDRAELLKMFRKAGDRADRKNRGGPERTDAPPPPPSE